MDSYGAGTVGALNDVVSASGGAGGTYKVAAQNVGSNVLICEGSEDAATWEAIDVRPVTADGLGDLQDTITADGFYSTETPGFYYFRVRCSSYSSGTISAQMFATDALGVISASLVAPIDGSGNLKVSQQGPSGLAAATYKLVTASGATTIKNSPGTLYAVIATANLSLTTFTLVDGSNTIIPSNALLNAAPNGIPFGPAGTAFTTSLVANLGALLTSPVIILYS